jgi:hypothetical protein
LVGGCGLVVGTGFPPTSGAGRATTALARARVTKAFKKCIWSRLSWVLEQRMLFE